MIRKYFAMLAMGIKESTSYRMAMFLWILVSVIWALVMPMIWRSVYESSGEIAGYSENQLTTYFLLMPIVESVTHYYVYEVIHQQVQDGWVTRVAIRPINYLVGQFCAETGYKIVRGGMSAMIMLVIILLWRSSFVVPHPSMLWGWLILLLPLAMILSMLVGALVGMVAFWTIRANWVNHLWWIVLNFTEGSIAPIAFYPTWLQHVMQYVPFPILSQTPILIITNKISSSEIVQQLLVAGVWIVALFGVVVWVWSRARRRIDGIGI